MSAAPGRRAFLSAGIAALGGFALTGCVDHAPPAPARSASASASAVRPALLTPSATPSASASAMARIAKHPLPGGTLGKLPAEVRGIAWTVDDGVSTAVVEAYARFAAATGTRITFFLNGFRPSWTEHADLLRPMVKTGQVQIANHTWSHPALTRLSDSAIQEELQRNHDFIGRTYGVDARPYYRPPFGYHDARVDAAAARVGYTTPVMWYGSLGDASPLQTKRIVSLGRQWFLPAHLVIGHANHPGTIDALPQLQGVLRQRKLGTYTLDDVFRRR